MTVVPRAHTKASGPLPSAFASLPGGWKPASPRHAMSVHATSPADVHWQVLQPSESGKVSPLACTFPSCQQVSFNSELSHPARHADKANITAKPRAAVLMNALSGEKTITPEPWRIFPN